MQAENGEKERIQIVLVKTKHIEKLSDNTSESLPMQTSLSTLIHVYSALLLGLSFQHLQDINYLSYRCPDDCSTATHELSSMDVSDSL